MQELALFTPPSEVVRECQSHRETAADSVPGAVVKAASGTRLTLEEVAALPDGISLHIDKWRDKVAQKFGGSRQSGLGPPSSEAGQTGSTSATVMVRADIAKLDEDRRLVFGWASIAEQDGALLVDKQNDIIRPETLEEAAYGYMLDSREGDAMHEGTPVFQVVESMVFTLEKQKALGIDLGKSGWWLGGKVHDEETWEAVRKGQYKAFSIGATAERVEVATG